MLHGVHAHHADVVGAELVSFHRWRQSDHHGPVAEVPEEAFAGRFSAENLGLGDVVGLVRGVEDGFQVVLAPVAWDPLELDLEACEELLAVDLGSKARQGPFREADADAAGFGAVDEAEVGAQR